ncbi:MAG: hypothetical protein DI634_09255 [Kocuria palustris]|nr:MAG: hypothetical protein DI634_09255 [Kocuria palustris]
MLDNQAASFGSTVAARILALGKPTVMVDGKQVRVERCSAACITGRDLHGDMTLINLDLARAVTILES